MCACGSLCLQVVAQAAELFQQRINAKLLELEEVLLFVETSDLLLVMEDISKELGFQDADELVAACNMTMKKDGAEVQITTCTNIHANIHATRL